MRVPADDRHRRGIAEAERTIDTLGFLGVEIFTDIAGKPLDSPEFLPIFARMAEYDRPILLHPRRTNTTIDYAGEAKSKFLVYTNFGWPYESSMAMARLAFGGVMDRFPSLKIVTHHAAGSCRSFTNGSSCRGTSTSS